MVPANGVPNPKRATPHAHGTERDHCESVETRRERLRPMWRHIRGDQEEPGQTEGLHRCFADVDVAAMNRIKRPTEDADAPGRRQGQAALARAAASVRHIASRRSGTPAPLAPEMR